uniref:diacylglycerol O-acyltransferase n=1 Tax=Brassica oleracea var. oleracea TaxID=109376 RepID=A0A0D3C0U2_BRAOL
MEIDVGVIKEKRKETMSTGEEDGEPLSPMARVFQSPGNDCCVITMIGCKTKINADVIRSGLKENISKHPRFSSKLSQDGLSWIKTQVNIEDHIFVADKDQNEIAEDGELFVEDYVSHLTMIPLNKSRPLWDIHILNIKTSDADAVCVIRSHHSLGDGTSLMSLLAACTQTTSHRDKATIPALKRHKRVYKDKVSWFVRLILAIFSSVRLIWNTFVDLVLFLAIALFLKDTKTPLKGDVGVESSPKKFCHRTVSLDDLRVIKEATSMVYGPPASTTESSKCFEISIVASLEASSISFPTEEVTETLDDLDLHDSSPLPLLKLDPEKMSEGPSLEVSNTEF